MDNNTEYPQKELNNTTSDSKNNYSIKYILSLTIFITIIIFSSYLLILKYNERKNKNINNLNNRNINIGNIPHRRINNNINNNNIINKFPANKNKVIINKNISIANKIKIDNEIDDVCNEVGNILNKYLNKSEKNYHIFKRNNNLI